MSVREPSHRRRWPNADTDADISLISWASRAICLRAGLKYSRAILRQLTRATMLGNGEPRRARTCRNQCRNRYGDDKDGNGTPEYLE